MTSEQTSKWVLQGFDTFAGESYGLPGEYDSEADAEKAARTKLAEIEKQQPTSSSGGQGFGGIQDRVYIIGPDGRSRRIRNEPWWIAELDSIHRHRCQELFAQFLAATDEAGRLKGEAKELVKLCADTARTFMRAGRMLERAAIEEQEGSHVTSRSSRRRRSDLK